MKKWTICILLFCAIGFLTHFSSAMLVGPFPGLDRAIEEADAVWVVTIEKDRISKEPYWIDYDVIVHRSIKRYVPKSKTVTVSVHDVEINAPSQKVIWTGLLPRHQYLLFLNKNREKKYSRADYISPHYEGCVFPLSMKFNPRETPGKTPRDIIKNLIDKTIELRELDLQILKEKAAIFLKE